RAIAAASSVWLTAIRSAIRPWTAGLIRRARAIATTRGFRLNAKIGTTKTRAAFLPVEASRIASLSFGFAYAKGSNQAAHQNTTQRFERLPPRQRARQYLRGLIDNAANVVILHMLRKRCLITTGPQGCRLPELEP